jgi:hypothetical protein
VVLRRHPDGALRADDFAVEAADALSPGEGEFVVRNLFVSVDPMLRLLIDARPIAGGAVALSPGSVIPGAAVGEIVESRHPDYAVGDRVEGRFGWRHYALSDGAGVHRVSAALPSLADALGIGGLPGFTAYVGLEDAGANVGPGKTVLVSGAAGAVGSMVGPLARARGARVVGIASGADKARILVEEAGYDAVADRTAPDFAEQLAAALPQGVDLYFDNVGGPMLATVAPLMARGGLVAICGLMAQYQGEGGGDLSVVLRAVMGRGVTIRSFTQYGRDAMRPAFEAEVARLLATGAIRPRTRVEDGIERLPHALAGLFEHGIAGKVVVRVAELTDKESE